jgi:hypothetical protein
MLRLQIYLDLWRIALPMVLVKLISIVVPPEEAPEEVRSSQACS